MRTTLAPVRIAALATILVAAPAAADWNSDLDGMQGRYATDPEHCAGPEALVITRTTVTRDDVSCDFVAMYAVNRGVALDLECVRGSQETFGLGVFVEPRTKDMFLWVEAPAYRQDIYERCPGLLSALPPSVLPGSARP